MSLTSSAFFSIFINGSPSSTFSPSIGIRQGDPLSPFLFTLMAEELGRSIKAAVETSRIAGLKLHGNYLVTSHLQFVENTILIGKPTVREAEAMK